MSPKVALRDILRHRVIQVANEIKRTGITLRHQIEGAGSNLLRLYEAYFWYIVLVKRPAGSYLRLAAKKSSICG
jgi:hypothetical protein